jgi:hypothetical protein
VVEASDESGIRPCDFFRATASPLKNHHVYWDRGDNVERSTTSSMRPHRSSRCTIISQLPALIHVFLFFLFLSLPLPTQSIKFALLAHRYPLPKCIWNTAHLNTLVIVTAHVSPGAYQRVDIEIIDSSPERRVYLNKKDLKGETRLAVTSHSEGEVGVCFRNYLDHSTFCCTV